MKHFMKSVFIFALLVIPSYLIFLFIVGSIPKINLQNLAYRLGGYGHLHSRLQEINKFENVNILFLGSSHAYRGFDVRVFEKQGLRSFNLGSSAQTPIQTQVLLNRYLNSLNPKLIVYAVAPAIFTSDGVESSIDLISNDRNDILSLEMALKINHHKTYNALIYGSIRDFLNMNSYFTQPIILKEPYYIDTYISGGYVEKTTDRYYTRSAKAGYQTINMDFKKYQLETFEKIISDFRNKNINFILVRTPVANYDAYINNGEFDIFIQQYGQYYNFNELLVLSDSYFYDANHLRQEGVEIFSSKVAEMILSLDIFPQLQP